MGARLVLGLGILGMAAAGYAQSGARLLVVEKGAQSLAIIDPDSGKRIASVAEGGITGHEVAASRDGKLAFVPIYGNSGVGKPGTDGREMVVIDIAAQKVIQRIDFGTAWAGDPVRPHLPVMGPPVAGHPDGLLYVTSELKNAITVIDPKNLKIIGAIPTGQAESHMLAVSHDGRWGYTANVGPGTVSVLDLTPKADGTWHNPVAVIPVSKEVQRISISMDDKMVFTSDETNSDLVVIDTATHKIQKRIPMESHGYGTAPTPDGRWLLVALEAANKVAVIDLKSRQVARNIDVAPTPQAILVTPNGKRAFVSCDQSGQVAEIDLSTWKVVRMIDAGKLADGLAWAE
jgi:YVTN family beta-propeller protein